MTKPVTNSVTLDVPEQAGKSRFVTQLRMKKRHSGVTYCPTCNHPIASDKIANDLGPIASRIYEMIRDAGTLGIARASLEAALYEGRRDGGPASNTVQVTISGQINPKLRKSGLRIRSRGFRFKLEKLDV